MFNAADYASLVKDGVSPGLLALVESSYHVLFEATAANNIPIRPVPWGEVADVLGIDTSDCVVDGEVRNGLVSKKANEDQRVKDISAFADAAMKYAVDYSGISQYENLMKSPALRNFLNNIRTHVVMAAVHGHASDNGSYDWVHSRDYIEYIGKEVGSRLKRWIVDSANRKNKFSGDIPDEVVTMPLMGSSGTPDGTVWVSSNGYPFVMDAESSAIILTVDNSWAIRFGVQRDDPHHLVKVEPVSHSADYSMTDPRSIYSDAFDFVVSGYFTGFDHTQSVCMAEFVTFGSPKSWVKACRDFPEYIDAIVESYDKSTGMHNIVLGMKFLQESFDNGKASADDLRDLLSGNRNEMMTSLSPDVYMDGIKKFGSSRAFYSAIHGMAGISRNFVAALTGDGTIEPDFGLYNDMNSFITDPAVQDAMYRNGDLSQVLSDIEHAADNARIMAYIPISDNIMNDVFNSSEQDEAARIKVITTLYNILSESRGMRGRRKLIEQIRTYITPRIQRELADCDSDIVSDAFEFFAEHVPGFRTSNAGGPILTTDLFETMSPRECIKLFLRAEQSHRFDPENLVLASTAPDVLEEVQKKKVGYLGQRIIELVRKNLLIPNTDHVPVLKFVTTHNNADEIYSRLATCLKTYLVPFMKNPQMVEMYRNDCKRIFDTKELSLAAKRLAHLALRVYRADAELGANLFLDGFKLFDFGLCREALMLATALTWWAHDCKEEVLRFAATLIAGKSLLQLIATEYPGDTSLASDLFELDNVYKNNVGDAADGASVISDADFMYAIENQPDLIITCLPVITDTSPEWLKRICDEYFTDETVNRMVSTEDGLMLLVRLIGISGWHGVASNIVESNRMRIEEVLSKIPREEANKVRETLYSNKQQMTRQTSKLEVNGLGDVEFSAANGLWWMKGYVKIPPKDTAGNPGYAESVDGKSTLFTRQAAEDYLATVRDSGWRLPTMNELRNLGGAENIKRMGIGFTPTGKTGKFANMYKVSCCAWYGDETGNIAGKYVVMNNTVKFIKPGDMFISDADSLAIKLVHSAH